MQPFHFPICGAAEEGVTKCPVYIKLQSEVSSGHGGHPKRLTGPVVCATRSPAPRRPQHWEAGAPPVVSAPMPERDSRQGPFLYFW